jgi:glycosyltransferase involved in cell wall biosynthesis
MNKRLPEHLHIVTHQVPWPVDFGGVFDLFYKIKSLAEAGVKIHLHCFTSANESSDNLLRFCESIHHYPRTSFFNLNHFSLPFIVRSRCDKKLIFNLQQDEFPILFEGIHTTYPLYKGYFKNRKVKVRLHNVEHLYYHKLATCERGFLKKSYFLWEAFLLKKYEKKLAKSASYWAVSSKDAAYYQSRFLCSKIDFLPVFLPWKSIKYSEGRGSYCLYHGNLSINENKKAVEWLLEEVFSKIDIPFVIAGKDPDEELKQKAHRFKHTCIVENLSEHELNDLIQKAQINILPSFNVTGVKLKVLHAMFNGRFCLVNRKAIEGSEISGGYIIAETPEEFKKEIEILFNKEYSSSDFEERKAGLKKYDEQELLQQIMAW